MINSTKELPQNATADHAEQNSKVSMIAPSSASLWYPQWIITSSEACLGQHLGHIVNNGQQFAVLHASMMPFL